jgi:hypothetical protein
MKPSFGEEGGRCEAGRKVWLLVNYFLVVVAGRRVCVLMVTSSGGTLEKYSHSPESSCTKSLWWDELNC